jgi:hypothetical protein
MRRDAAEGEYRPGLWMIRFTALDGQQAREYVRRAAGGEATHVAAAGPYRFAAVETHRQVIAVRDVTTAAGESFAITRAIMAERHSDGQVLSYESGDPDAFREQARTRLGLDPVDDDRWGWRDSSGAPRGYWTSSFPTTRNGVCGSRTLTRFDPPKSRG